MVLKVCDIFTAAAQEYLRDEKMIKSGEERSENDDERVSE